jgi:hypothetical protein
MAAYHIRDLHNFIQFIHNYLQHIRINFVSTNNDIKEGILITYLQLQTFSNYVSMFYGFRIVILILQIILAYYMTIFLNKQRYNQYLVFMKKTRHERRDGAGGPHSRKFRSHISSNKSKTPIFDLSHTPIYSP